MTQSQAQSAAPMAASAPKPLLTMRGIETFYGKIQALKGIDIDVNEGEIVTLIGANGAGKSTTMMTIFGSPRARKGSITFAGRRAATATFAAKPSCSHRLIVIRWRRSRWGRRLRSPRMSDSNRSSVRRLATRSDCSTRPTAVGDTAQATRATRASLAGR